MTFEYPEEAVYERVAAQEKYREEHESLKKEYENIQRILAHVLISIGGSAFVTHKQMIDVSLGDKQIAIIQDDAREGFDISIEDLNE